MGCNYLSLPYIPRFIVHYSISHKACMWFCCVLFRCDHRVESRFAPSRWETALLCNDVSHWLGASIKLGLDYVFSSGLVVRYIYSYSSRFLYCYCGNWAFHDLTILHPIIFNALASLGFHDICSPVRFINICFWTGNPPSSAVPLQHAQFSPNSSQKTPP